MYKKTFTFYEFKTEKPLSHSVVLAETTDGDVEILYWDGEDFYYNIDNCPCGYDVYSWVYI